MNKEVMNNLRRQLILGLVGWGAIARTGWPQTGHSGHHEMHQAQGLGTSVALDPQGRMWIACTEAAEMPAATGQLPGAFVVLQMSSDSGRSWTAPRRVQRVPEPIEAAGESRPKLAFGRGGEVYVTYTRPLAKPYTGEIRFVRSVDGGQTFAAPITVHKDRALITHRFDSLIVDRKGRLYVAWIDKRDALAAKARGEQYPGAAVYYAVSDDGGKSFKDDFKLADHSCECCRIALALDPDGQPVAMWRAVFGADVRDHAIGRLTADGTPVKPTRATFDNWHIDACPHHGPALAYAPDGTRHQVWFDVVGDDGGVFYASVPPGGRLGTPLRLGTEQAEHGDVAVLGKRVAVVWKQFDGKSTSLLARTTSDAGKTWNEDCVAQTSGDSDEPHLVTASGGIVLLWRTKDEGARILQLV